MSHLPFALSLVVCLSVAACAASPAPSFVETAAPSAAASERSAAFPADGTDWNDKQITWWPLQEGLEEARRTGRPAIFVSYRPTCPASVEFSGLFRDEAIVALSKSYVMIRASKHGDVKAAESFNLDGTYVPRVVFLTPQGKVRTSYESGSPSYRFFYNDWNRLAEHMYNARRQPNAL